jgi:FkbM family methyltransferase
MTDIKIQKQNEKAEVVLDGNTLGELGPQEVWDLSEALREFAIEHSDDFKEKALFHVEIAGLSFQVIAGNNTDFWTLVNSGKWEPTTFEVFNRFLNRDTVFLDIGAWVGSTALYGAQLAKHTYAFEPDHVAFETLKSNVSVNGDANWFNRLSIYNAAAGVEDGTLQLGNPNEAGNSMSSALHADEDDAWKAKCLGIENFIERNGLKGQKTFFKIDIEGGEYDLVPALQSVLKDNPSSLLLSIHGNFLLESLRSKSKGPFKELKVRMAFYRKHKRLLKSLPYSHIEHADGRPVDLRKQLLKSFVTGTFVTEIVAY